MRITATLVVNRAIEKDLNLQGFVFGASKACSFAGAIWKINDHLIVFLIHVLLPLNANDGQPLPQAAFSRVRAELQEKFGGLTVYSRAPAEGLWQENSVETVRDNIVLFEVMTDDLDRDWWREYRIQLEQRFRQQEVVIRAQEIERL